jgi:hypothetical protein
MVMGKTQVGVQNGVGTLYDEIYYMECEHPAARSDRISEASRLYSLVALVCILTRLQQLGELS